MKSFLLVVVILAVATNVYADLYMHNPRGSNDRNCERNTNRNNGNRLFDSQNNDKGGYACPRAVGGPEVMTPRMYYYAGSQLQIEWTNQHGCNNDHVNCDIVIQYMCAPPAGQMVSMSDPMYPLLNPGIRDGIPTDANDAATDRMDADDVNDTRYGYHETYDYYLACDTRYRNMGLWIADQDLAGNTAIFDRQNPNGNRQGWECQEERDYYPYWHPSPWKDIAVLTTENNCGWYQKESQNVMAKYWCIKDDGSWAQQNQEPACVNSGYNWVQVPAWNLSKPDCRMPEWSRDNHLGNTLGGNLMNYVWTIPSLPDTMDQCVLRMRYNISNANIPYDLDHSDNDEASPIIQDPLVHVEGEDTDKKKMAINLSLAVNTDQYGRTFQDRSYVFTIKKRSDGSAPAAGNIWNINVRGKRGNIVQTYPAIEYDFVPQYLELQKGDYVHFQWIGSDYNPNTTPNNAEGGPVDPTNADNYRADRSNAVPIQKKWMGINPDAPTGTWFGVLTKAQMVALAYTNQDMSDCLSLQELYDKHSNGGAVDTDDVERDSQNCMKINAAKTPYFDLATPIQMKKAGMYNYMSTRNNNFSNRNQRAYINVHDTLTTKEKAAIGVGVSVGVGGAAAGGAWMYSKRQ